MITKLNERSRTVFQFIVDTYLSTGEPVGSRTISKHVNLSLSAASIRNTMADLEDAGLLFAPHISAGRLPTEQGLRMYVDGLMQVGNLAQQDRKEIENACRQSGRPVNEVLKQASSLLSGLSSCASLVISPKMGGALKHVQFVALTPQSILTILVFENGMIENRVLDIEEPVPASALIAASNYLNAKLSGKTLAAAEKEIQQDISQHKTQLDTITQRLVEKGLALPSQKQSSGRIIIHGQSHLLEDVKALEDLESARMLLGYLEEQEHMLELLGTIDSADGVQIFIGTENKIFNQSGWSMIISPYTNNEERIIGAIGVIGPTRLNYDRIVPMVDYTSQIVSKIVDGS